MSTVVNSTNTLGFAGLGNLGQPMAHRLLSQGWNVTVFDSAASKQKAFREPAATVATSFEELLEVDVLVLVVPDDATVEALLAGPGGYLERDGDGRLVIVHSTILPQTAQRLARYAEERGVSFVDAPVSGGSDRAANGDLTVYLGASRADADRAGPLLRTVASTVNHVGPPGAAAAVKLANQVMLFTALGGIHEALGLAEAYGVEESLVLEGVATSTGSSWATDNWGFFDRTARSYTEGDTAVRDRPWSKDPFEALQAAHVAGLDLPITAVVSQTVANYVEAHARKECP